MSYPAHHPLSRRRYVSDGPGLELDARTLRDACALKRASLVLGNALGRGVSATHARSETSVISSFDVGERHVFVVASEMREVAAELFDARAAETALAGVLEALARDLDPGNKRGA